MTETQVIKVGDVVRIPGFGLRQLQAFGRVLKLGIVQPEAEVPQVAIVECPRPPGRTVKPPRLTPLAWLLLGLLLWSAILLCWGGCSGLGWNAGVEVQPSRSWDGFGGAQGGGYEAEPTVALQLGVSGPLTSPVEPRRREAMPLIQERGPVPGEPTIEERVAALEARGTWTLTDDVLVPTVGTTGVAGTAGLGWWLWMLLQRRRRNGNGAAT